MMWTTFIVKRFSAAAYLMEKVTVGSVQVPVCDDELYKDSYPNPIFQVGKAPKDRLCRRVSDLWIPCEV